MNQNNILPIINKELLKKANAVLEQYGIKHIDEKQAICALNEYRKIQRVLDK